jgi:GTPase SAR1 family protein
MPGSSFLHNHQSHFETLIYSVYYAPRGRPRLYTLAGQLAGRYLTPNDLLIGIIGTEGSGKSTLIKGLFPGLELTNDDEGVNVKPTPIYDFQPEDFFAPHTFHLDVRYELAFKQKFEIVDAVNMAIEDGRRVVIEHFDLLYEALGFNAQILFGIGDEVIVARPTVFGPRPHSIKGVVEKTTRFRKMAHSAEDITSFILAKDYNYTRRVLHSDVKHGFVIKFPEIPEISISQLEEKVRDVIRQNVPIGICCRDRIRIGEWEIYCTGARTHVKTSGEIEDFRLHKEYVFDPIWKEYMLVGMVGKKDSAGIEEMVYFDE